MRTVFIFNKIDSAIIVSFVHAISNSRYRILQIRQIGIIAEDDSFFANLIGKALEGRDVVVKIFVVVDVVEFNVGQQSVIGMIRQEVTLEFT